MHPRVSVWTMARNSGGLRHVRIRTDFHDELLQVHMALFD